MSDPLQEARRLSEQKVLAKLREGTEILRTGGGVHLTASDCHVLLDWAQRVEDAERENERLKGISVVPLENGRQVEIHRWGWDVEIALPDDPNELEVYVSRVVRQALRQEKE